VLPPVSILLSKEAAAYHFLSGYTAAGRIDGGGLHANPIKSPPSPPASGRPSSRVRHGVYADLLMKRMEQFGSQRLPRQHRLDRRRPRRRQVRFPIPVTRAIVHAIQSGALEDAETEFLDGLQLAVPTAVPGVDAHYLKPRDAWSDTDAYDAAARSLIEKFVKNFERFDVDEAIVAAGPRLA
jgi:phosphoenolpyruvate carboxykinase (ATP)